MSPKASNRTENAHNWAAELTSSHSETAIIYYELYIKTQAPNYKAATAQNGTEMAANDVTLTFLLFSVAV